MPIQPRAICLKPPLNEEYRIASAVLTAFLLVAALSAGMLIGATIEKARIETTHGPQDCGS